MIGHIIKYKLMIHLRQRAGLFWTLIYPLVLALFFSMAFSNLGGADKFTSFQIGIVDNTEFRGQPYFISALGAVSDKATSPDDKLFDVAIISKTQAEERLRDNTIKGYIEFDNGPHVVVSSSGLEQTILKEFVESYIQQSSAVATILKHDPAHHENLKLPNAQTLVKQAENRQSSGNNTVIMYYALISMTVMFGGFRGRSEVVEIQANLSPQAARINMAPVNKLKSFLCSISTSCLLQIASLLILVAFMSLVLGVSFGSQLGYIILLCVVAGIMGVSFGAFLTAVIPGKESTKNAIMLSVSMLGSVMAGMVSPSLKYIISNAAPVLQYINPANLVSDALYAVYYYGGGARYALNVLLMLGFSVVFSLSVYFVMRRQKYASL